MIDYYSLAINFRRLIEKAKNRGDFSIKDRMFRFPMGCCDDATDIIAHYMFKEFGMKTTRVDGVYYDENPEKNIWHTWLEINGIIIDLTADQFPEYSDVYVGCLDEFHSKFEVIKQDYYGYTSLGDSCWNRMNELYCSIIK